MCQASVIAQVLEERAQAMETDKRGADISAPAFAGPAPKQCGDIFFFAERPCQGQARHRRVFSDSQVLVEEGLQVVASSTEAQIHERTSAEALGLGKVGGGPEPGRAA